MTATLSTPLRLGPLHLRNRVVAAPMERNYCHADGAPTAHYLDRISAVARGGSALVYAEAAFVRADGKVRPRQLGVDGDAAIPGLRRLADAVHAEGALFGMQLVHGGRLARASISGYVPVAPSPVVAEVIDGDLPDELDPTDIADLVEKFARAAHRSAIAGADVVSIHAAHGYLISQFLSARTNHRTDAYADPARFLREVIAAVRAAAPEAVVGIRVSGYEGVPGGIDVAQTLEILARAGAASLDFIDVSAGCYESGQLITPTGELPRGLHAETARRFRELGPPVGVAGRIIDGADAERILAAGDADFVTVGRAVHADPDWPVKVLRDEASRPCISCNYCADALRTGEPVGCAVNPEAHQRLPAVDGGHHDPSQDVLVVGAGPAGLEATRRFAAAGHRTRLVDRRDQLGGTLALAAQLHEYPEYHRIIDWYAEQLTELGVTVELSTALTPDRIAEQPEDIVVLATGLLHPPPDVPGAESSRVRELADWLTEGPSTPLEASYVVWGGDRNATAVADHLAAHGARVVMIGAQTEPAQDVGPRATLLPLARLRTNPRVRLMMSSAVESISQGSLRVRTSEGTQQLHEPGPVIVSLDGTAAAAVSAEVRAAAPAKTVIPIGDAAGHGGWTATAVRHAAEAVTQVVGNT